MPARLYGAAAAQLKSMVVDIAEAIASNLKRA
jgi:hypothetical protein